MIRIIHHQACTGGTIITRCLAALENVLVLSEISPFGRIIYDARFEPLNAVGALLNGNRQFELTAEERVAFFGKQMKAVFDLTESRSMILLVRDHSHSAYMETHQPAGAELTAILGAIGQTRSITTVRYPLTSYLALKKNKWDPDIEDYGDYCRRYIDFMTHHQAAPIFRYEDFCVSPHASLRDMANVLSLPYGEAFMERVGAIRLTGNSGRAARENRIRVLPFQDYSEALRDEMLAHDDHVALCRMLGYPEDIRRYAQGVDLDRLYLTMADEHCAEPTA